MVTADSGRPTANLIYPFTPVGNHEQDQQALFKLESVLDGELDLEKNKEYWYPIWPDSPDDHPWG